MDKTIEVTRVKDSAFMEECHECDNITRHMWQTRHCTLRACSQACAQVFNDSGADLCNCSGGDHGN